MTDPVFVVGAPRSGTTWLAKIFDSHPDVVYRHEPDEIRPAPRDMDAGTVASLIAAWSADRRPRTAAKRPYFTKSWRGPMARRAWPAMAYAMLAAGRLPLAGPLADRVALPDLGDRHRARTVIKTVRWCDGIGQAARVLPDSRTILILRRPCGQVHSLMRGALARRFDLRNDGDQPYDEDAARACAEAHGVGREQFHRLSDAGRFAWGWVAFNEAVEAGIIGLPNILTILYEDLVSDPIPITRRAFAFAGLAWHPQAEAFIRHSVNGPDRAGYYDVVQNAVAAANRWREAMAVADQRAVQDVVRRSSLARHWEDLARQAAMARQRDLRVVLGTS